MVAFELNFFHVKMISIVCSALFIIWSCC